MPLQPVPDPLHIYRVTLSNAVALFLAGVSGLCLSAYLGFHVANALHSPGMGEGPSTLYWVSGMAALLLITGTRLLLSPFRARMILSRDRIQFPSTLLRKRALLFADIRGRRGAGHGMYLVRRDGRRLWLNETLFRLDPFYRDWLSTIPDLSARSRPTRSRTSGSSHTGNSDQVLFSREVSCR